MIEQKTKNKDKRKYPVYYLFMFFALCSFIFFLCAGCQKEETITYHEETLDVNEVVMPDSIRLGNEVNYKVYFNYRNGCGLFLRNEITEDVREVAVKCIARYPDNTTCAAITPRDSVYINFAPQLSGTFVFTFHNSTGNVVDSIVVY